jgi:uncharacterized membrane protein
MRMNLKSLPRSLFVLLGAYTLVMFGLACRKYNVMNSDTGDMAMVVNSFWYTIHGRMFYSPYIGMSFLGNHAALILFLFVPFYWVAPSIYTLFFLQSTMIALSGVPFFLIARRVVESKRAALLLTIGYLFYPTVVANHVDQIHVEHLALPFLLGALYLFLEQQFWPFVIFALLGMTGQENLALTVGFFGVYAAVKRRGLRWILTPMALALVYGLFVFKVVLPHFASGSGYLPAHYFGALGKTPGDVAKTVVTQPWKLIGQVWDLDRGLYLLKMLQPVLWIAPLCSWEFLLALPSLGVNLVVEEPAFRVIPWHYGPTVGAFLCVAAVFGIKRLAQAMERRWKLAQAQFALAFATCAVSVSSWVLWFNVGEYLPHAYYPTLQRAVEKVPPEKSVLAPVSMLAHFANRQYPFHRMQFDPNLPMAATRPREKMYSMDYVILDGNERRFPMEIVTRELVMSYWTNTNYQLIFNENNVFVFRRAAANSPSP